MSYSNTEWQRAAEVSWRRSLEKRAQAKEKKRRRKELWSDIASVIIILVVGTLIMLAYFAWR